MSGGVLGPPSSVRAVPAHPHPLGAYNGGGTYELYIPRMGEWPSESQRRVLNVKVARRGGPQASAARVAICWVVSVPPGAIGLPLLTSVARRTYIIPVGIITY